VEVVFTEMATARIMDTQMEYGMSGPHLRIKVELMDQPERHVRGILVLQDGHDRPIQDIIVRIVDHRQGQVAEAVPKLVRAAEVAPVGLHTVVQDVDIAAKVMMYRVSGARLQAGLRGLIKDKEQDWKI